MPNDVFRAIDAVLVFGVDDPSSRRAPSPTPWYPSMTSAMWSAGYPT